MKEPLKEIFIHVGNPTYEKEKNNTEKAVWELRLCKIPGNNSCDVANSIRNFSSYI